VVDVVVGVVVDVIVVDVVVTPTVDVVMGAVVVVVVVICSVVVVGCTTSGPAHEARITAKGRTRSTNFILRWRL
jgi:hypothetical protein